MTEQELKILLQNLLSLADENEVVEFKAKQNFDFHKLGKYISALRKEDKIKVKEGRKWELQNQRDL